LSYRDIKGWQALAFFVFEMEPCYLKAWGGKKPNLNNIHNPVSNARIISKSPFSEIFSEN